jgi:hypothetical protein
MTEDGSSSFVASASAGAGAGAGACHSNKLIYTHVIVREKHLLRLQLQLHHRLSRPRYP